MKMKLGDKYNWKNQPERLINARGADAAHLMEPRNNQQEGNMHPLLINLPPAISRALKPYFKAAPTICRRCGTAGDAMFHTLSDCESLQKAKARHDAGYLRATNVMHKATQAELAADDIAANYNKAAKAHAHQELTGLIDQINDKTGFYQ